MGFLIWYMLFIQRSRPFHGHFFPFMACSPRGCRTFSVQQLSSIFLSLCLLAAVCHWHKLSAAQEVEDQNMSLAATIFGYYEVSALRTKETQQKAKFWIYVTRVDGVCDGALFVHSEIPYR